MACRNISRQSPRAGPSRFLATSPSIPHCCLPKRNPHISFLPHVLLQPGSPFAGLVLFQLKRQQQRRHPPAQSLQQRTATTLHPCATCTTTNTSALTATCIISGTAVSDGEADRGSHVRYRGCGAWCMMSGEHVPGVGGRRVKVRGERWSARELVDGKSRESKQVRV